MLVTVCDRRRNVAADCAGYGGLSLAAEDLRPVGSYLRTFAAKDFFSFGGLFEKK